MTKHLKRKPKEHLVQIAIDQKYYDYLQAKTQSLGITRSEYIRALINSEHIKEKGIQLELSGAQSKLELLSRKPTH
jgi:negative regulator of replication initiation